MTNKTLSQFLTNIVRYKDIVWYRTLAQLKSESKQFYLGYIWFLLEPALATATLFLVFGVILNNKSGEFVVFLVIGMTVWQWFEAGVNEGMMGTKMKLPILSQIPLPKYLFPLVQIFSATWKFAFVFMVVLTFAWVCGFAPNKHYPELLIVLGAQLLLIVGIALPCSVAASYYEDTMRVVQSVFRLLFYLSGIFFSAEKVPEELKMWFYVNPMAGLIESYRAIILHQSAPELSLVLYPLMLGCVMAILGVICCVAIDKKLMKSVAV
ncbi:MAG: ABC transporter permease [Opitutales bacterium]|tara:strand:+ start:4787 stop:5584 length:798 start_codon:yes stop_codon:yes gene_type:complete